MTKKSIAEEYRDFKDDYAYVADIFTEEDDRVRKCKYILTTLSVWERTILLYYAEYASIRKVAAKFGIGRQLAFNIIKEIQNKIKGQL